MRVRVRDAEEDVAPPQVATTREATRLPLPLALHAAPRPASEGLPASRSIPLCAAPGSSRVERRNVAPTSLSMEPLCAPLEEGQWGGGTCAGGLLGGSPPHPDRLMSRRDALEAELAAKEGRPIVAKPAQL